MLKDKNSLFKMLPSYEACDLIGEILIIDNVGFDRGLVRVFKKVRVLNDGKNIFVNPAWNLGVKEAKYERIIIANDDIAFDLDPVMEVVDDHLQEGMICGFSINCFAKKRNGSPLAPTLRIVKHTTERAYGFGVFMVLFKSTYFPVPKEFKVWCGDSLQFAKHDVYLIEGVDVITKMQRTTSTMRWALLPQRKFEQDYWKQYQKTL